MAKRRACVVALLGLLAVVAVAALTFTPAGGCFFFRPGLDAPQFDVAREVAATWDSVFDVEAAVEGGGGGGFAGSLPDYDDSPPGFMRGLDAETLSQALYDCPHGPPGPPGPPGPFRMDFACGFELEKLCGERRHNHSNEGSWASFESIDNKTMDCIKENKDKLKSVCKGVMLEKQAFHCGHEVAELCGLPKSHEDEEFRDCLESHKKQLQKVCPPRNATEGDLQRHLLFEDLKCATALTGFCEKVPFFARRACFKTVASGACQVAKVQAEAFDCGVTSAYFCAKTLDESRPAFFVCLLEHRRMLAQVCPSGPAPPFHPHGPPRDDGGFPVLTTFAADADMADMGGASSMAGVYTQLADA